MDSEDLKAAKDTIHAVLKGRKILRMYPANNPVYVKTLEESFSKFTNFFYFSDNLQLAIKQNDIFYNGETVYSNPEKEDNLALFFFKDGIREITFRKGLGQEEMEDFFKIISLDFERDVVDDDIVTLFWERDFQNIHYIVDETVLSDLEDDYEERSTEHLKEETNQPDNIMQAYEDASGVEPVSKELTVMPLTDKDLHQLLKEIEKESLSRATKLANILFEMLYLSENRNDFDELSQLFKGALEFSLRTGEMSVVSTILTRIRTLLDDKKVPDAIKEYIKKITQFAGSEPMIDMLGEILDSSQEIEDGWFEQYFTLLDKNAIAPLIKILGSLENIHSRKVIIEALTLIGPKDIVTLAKGLDDPRWYVVRNIIYILRKIGDKRAVDYLLRTVRHADIRVKKEVLRTLGDLGGGGVFQALRESLDDPEIQVRLTGLKALGTVGSEAAKKIIMDRITQKEFRDKEFEEKKEYFETLSRWKDRDVYNFLVGQIKARSFFGRAKIDENRACAIHAIGILGNRDAADLVGKYRNDSNKIVRDYALIASKRLEHGSN